VAFTRRYPKIGEAWDLLGEAGNTGPLDPKTARLVKLGIHIATRSEGGTHAAVRKGMAARARRNLPGGGWQRAHEAAAVAAFTWVARTEKGGSASGGRRRAAAYGEQRL
jgi:alkylhydroperoxidase/carboxymuconolactone decarboxylase family protein YurZ